MTGTPAAPRNAFTHMAMLVMTLPMLGACGTPPTQKPSDAHLRAESAQTTVRNIPAPVQNTASLAKPGPVPKVETYSVVVNNIRAQDLLFALARDARINVDIHPGLAGTITLNAIDQTLQQLLSRIARQVDMRWEIDGPNLVVMPDSPFLRTYKVDYVNMSRDISGTVAINTQIASTSTAALAGTGSGTTAGAGGGNNSSTMVTSKSKNNFWESLDRNTKDILRETDKILPEGSSETVVERMDQQSTTGTGAQQQPSPAGRRNGANNAQPAIAGSPGPVAIQQQGTTVVRRTTFREAASVIVNPEAGIVVVRATSRQHEKVQEYFDLVLSSSRRQVMIEATIAEVELTDSYEQGINWSSLRAARMPAGGTAGFSMIENPSGPTLATTGSAFLLNYVAPGLGIASTLKLLETFGNVKVLSSPKISVLNNQTAMIKVVDNYVYFTIKSDTTTNTATSQTTFTATPNSVAVGLVMSVTPQISESNIILLNVRPTISDLRTTTGRQDPTPGLAVPSFIPEIKTREMESMLRLTDGEIAVMGGLMSDRLNNSTEAIPFLSKLPGIGTLFTQRNDVSKKTELVIFLKPTIIRDPSLAGDYRELARRMPNRDFFANNPGPTQPHIDINGGQTR